jgi:hypothetical protein
MRNGSHTVRLFSYLPAFFAFLLLTTCYLLLAVNSAAAAEFTALPAIIDAKGKAREIIHQTITVENTSDRLLDIYPWVADLDAATGATGKTDLGGGSPYDGRATSISRWIEVTRGVISLLPDEKREIPVLIQIDLGARPAIYHGAIRFSMGPNRDAAEKNIAETAEVLVNIEVLEDKNIRLQLSSFAAVKNMFTGGLASFDYALENIGNRGVVPAGKVRIYDRSGQEVATVDVNADAKSIAPSKKELLAASWAADGRFGRYKALLDVSYGDRGTLQDTVFFWVLPWQKVAGLFAALVVACVVVAVLLHSRSMAGRLPPRAEHEHYAFANIRPTHRRNDSPEEEFYDEVSEVDIPPPQRTIPGLATAKSVMKSAVSVLRKKQHIEEEFMAEDEYQQYHEQVRPKSVHAHSSRQQHTPHQNKHPKPVINEHRVHLAHKPKPPVDPAHIVSLRRK